MGHQDLHNHGKMTSPKTVALASIFGTTIEFYDFIIYGTLTALVFNKVFFPSFDSQIGTLLAFATFATGFLSRPLGGIIFGHLGDKISRKSALVITLLIMGLSTFAIGLLPTYTSIGIWSPLLLVALRFCQGLGAGGEWGGAVLMAVEHSPKKKRGFYGSLVQMGSPLGIILSSAVVSILLATLSDEQFLAWGWRIPLLISIILVGLGAFIRLKVLESPALTQVKEENKEAKVPLFEIFRKHPKNVLVGSGLHLGDAAFGYLIGVFMLSYATGKLGLSNSFAVNSNLFANFAYLLLAPVAGALSDKFGRKQIYTIGTVALILYIWPFFWLVNTGQPSMYFLAQAIASGITGFLFGVQATLYTELFSARVRYTGVSFGFQVSAVIGGGFMPTIASLLQGWAHGGTWLISSYIVLLGVLQLIAVSAARKVNE